MVELLLCLIIVVLGHSLMKRRVRLSQALGPRIRSVLSECDVEDAEDHRRMIGQIDNLISVMNVTQVMIHVWCVWLFLCCLFAFVCSFPCFFVCFVFVEILF